MSVVLDTGLFLALLGRRDRHRDAALAFMGKARSGHHGTLLAPDAVYVEAMNYLRRKPARRATCEAMRALRTDPHSPVRWLATDDGLLARAEEVYFRHFERGLSMTDALVLAAAHSLGAAVATFDTGLHGLVDIVV